MIGRQLVFKAASGAILADIMTEFDHLRRIFSLYRIFKLG